MMTELASRRGGANDAVPAIVDAPTWAAFHLTAGAEFTVQVSSQDSAATRFIALEMHETTHDRLGASIHG